MSELQQIFKHLHQPEYVHVLINPLPVYATIMAVTALVLSTLWLHKHAQVVSLILVVIACASVWPVVYYGQAAYDNVYAMSDMAAQQWLDLHMKRAEQFQYLFYATALVAMAAIVAAWKWPRVLKHLCWAVLAMSVASISVGGWISHAGGQVRHAEFREGPPPYPVAHEEHEHKAGEVASDHGAEQGKPAGGQPMDHGAMQGKPVQGQMNHSAMQPKPAEGAQQAEKPTPEQLEASRLQLEASRLQLEASRKQLEAADAAKKQTASPAPQQTQPSPSTEDHQHKDDHDHDQ
jgi:signal transduction histidine kinase